MTKICDIPYPIYDLTKNSKPNLWGKYKTWTPGPWTPSMDGVHENMDRVHGPPIMDRVHGPPIFTTPEITDLK